MRGLLAVLTFLVLSTSLITLAGVIRKQNKEYVGGLSDAMLQKEVFYEARNKESVFLDVLEVEGKDGIPVLRSMDWKRGELDFDMDVRYLGEDIETMIYFENCTVFIKELSPGAGRDVLYLKIEKEGYSTYSLIPAGETLKIC